MSKDQTTYLFDGQQQTLDAICSKVTCYTRKRVLEHIKAGRNTTQAITTFSNKTRLAQPWRKRGAWGSTGHVAP